jgi:hypothetical protein
MAVQARCERTVVQLCRMTFDEKADFGSVMPILSVGVRWGRVLGWVCKPEVTGSIPVRSTEKRPSKRGLSDFPGRMGIENEGRFGKRLERRAGRGCSRGRPDLSRETRPKERLSAATTESYPDGGPEQPCAREPSERAGSSTPRSGYYRWPVLTPRVGAYGVCGHRPHIPSFFAFARSASRSSRAAYLPLRPS